MEPKKFKSAHELNAHYHYRIRLMIRNTFMTTDEISTALGETPDWSWAPGERDFTPTAMWGMSSWTEGRRDFFQEMREVLLWLEEKREFVTRLTSSGGEFHVIAELPGSINIGSEIDLETLALALNLGVRIGVEVYPHLRQPRQETAQGLKA